MDELDKKLAALTDHLGATVGKIDQLIGPGSDRYVRLECLRLANTADRYEIPRDGIRTEPPQAVLARARGYADFVFGAASGGKRPSWYNTPEPGAVNRELDEHELLTPSALAAAATRSGVPSEADAPIVVHISDSEELYLYDRCAELVRYQGTKIPAAERGAVTLRLCRAAAAILYPAGGTDAVK